MVNFQKEITRISAEINRIRKPDDLCFCLLGNCRLSDNSSAVREHIRRVDEQVHFDCLIHLGDILRGNNPKKVSRMLLQREMEAYRNSLENRKLFVVQGESDGYRDEAFCGQLVCGIIENDAWYEDTAFIDVYENVHRKENRPYYYVDFPQYQIRFVFLCSNDCYIDKSNLFFERYTSFDLEQLLWLQNEALDIEGGWRVLLFSHAMPKSRFETGKDPFTYKGVSTEKFLNILNRSKVERQIDIICWCAGHYLRDEEISVTAINHILIGSPILEDEVWDAVVLKKDERKIYFYRFGTGKDRVIYLGDKL